jgi:phage portal protein BeeE
MLHIDLGSPDPLSDGLSPYTAARKAVTLDALASQRQAYGAQNVAQVGMVLRTRGTLSKEQREVFRAEINSAHAGAAKSGAPLVIGDNVEVIDAPKQAPENMLDLRKYNQTEICAVTGTPPPVIGIYDSATLANFKQCLKIWWAVRLEPRLRLVYEAFNRQVFKLADRQVWFDLSSSQLALPLVLERAEVAEKLVVGLGYPANAAARRVGLDLEYFPELDLPNVKFTIAGRTGGKDAET